MALTPAMLASNMLVARASAELIPPVALAVGRWTIAALILLPFTAKPLWQARRALRREWLDIFILGALGMGICGAVVYAGAATTTATNIGLIFSASPVIIIVLARVFYGEAMSLRQAFGVALSLLGVITIVARGDLDVLHGLAFTPGDLCMAAGAIAWAVYTIMLQHRPTVLASRPRLTASALAGIILMLPFLVLESRHQVPRFDALTVSTMAFVAIVPGLLTYLTYDFLQRRLGANRTSLLMYLVPLYNAGLAWILLGERLQYFHLIGAALVLPGLWLATRKP